jgi:hypothetical protein
MLKMIQYLPHFFVLIWNPLEIGIPVICSHCLNKLYALFVYYCCKLFSNASSLSLFIIIFQSLNFMELNSLSFRLGWRQRVLRHPTVFPIGSAPRRRQLRHAPPSVVLPFSFVFWVCFSDVIQAFLYFFSPYFYWVWVLLGRFG